LLDDLEGIYTQASFMALWFDTVVGFSQFLLLTFLVAVWTELIDPSQGDELPEGGLLLLVLRMDAVKAMAGGMAIFGG
jgi:hypothetical protein